MKIVLKGKMPDGTELQLEDWSENRNIFGLTIAAYPIAKNTSKWGWVKKGERFRLALDYFESNVEARVIFNMLQDGSLSLEDCSDNFWHYERYCYYLGLRETED